MHEPCDGGPAFPAPCYDPKLGNPGMSLRVYLAAAALPGVMAMVADGSHQRSPGDPQDGAEFIAQSAIRVADALIKASAHQGGGDAPTNA